MTSIIKQHIHQSFSHFNTSKLLLAVSGGIDSVVMTHVMHQLGYDIALAHVNFQLRDAESQADEDFVKALAAQWNLPFFIEKVETEIYAQTHKLSIQMAARDLRYQWFDSLLQTEHFDYLLTAHHLDDSLETFFINLNRKTGLEGLTGIPEVNGTTIRPLLPFSRAEILQYAQENHLIWREDSSNATTKYERNKIRHTLFPVLEQINPDFRKDFAQSMQYLSYTQALVTDYIALLKAKFWNEKEGIVHIYLMELQKLPHYQSILFELLKPYGFTDWETVFDLVAAQSGKKVLSEPYQLLKDRSRLILSTISKNQVPKGNLTIENRIEIGNLSYQITRLPFDEKINFKKKGIEYLDAEKVSFPLHIRTWKTGDYFYPLGMNGSKKLSDYFVDLKLSVIEKEKIWLLCDAQDQILWVIGYRIDNRYKVTQTTKNLIKIEPTL
jgi:tRNA(Ile)-lysidine synthase